MREESSFDDRSLEGMSKRGALLLASWILLWSLAGVFVAASLAHGPLAGIPHVQDEVVYTWQAERLLEGALSTPVPEPAASRIYYFLLDRDGRRYGIFPLGWPIVLALGAAIGAAAYVNALLHGLTVWVGAGLARRLGGASAALLAAPLLALSPQAVLQGASRMSHSLVALLGLLALAVAIDRRQWRRPVARGWALGAAIGWIVLTRPFDALVIAAVLVPLALWPRREWRPLLACVAALVVAVAWTAVENRAATGSAFRFAQSAYFDEMPPPIPGEFWRYQPGCNALGFGADRGCFETYGTQGYTPAKALANARQNLALVARLWLGHGFVLLLLPLGLLLSGARRIAAAALALALALVLAYALYWFHGACFGARFYHAALAPVIVACAVTVAELARRWRAPAAVGLLLLLPMVARLVGVLPELESYWAVDDRFHRMARGWRAGEAVVMVGYRDDLRLIEAPESADLIVGALPDIWRGAWFDVPGPLHFIEFQPQLVAAVEHRYPGLPLFLYLMSADRASDEIRPLVPSDRAPDQLPDLAQPTWYPLFASSQGPGARREVIERARPVR